MDLDRDTHRGRRVRGCESTAGCTQTSRDINAASPEPLGPFAHLQPPTSLSFSTLGVIPRELSIPLLQTGFLTGAWSLPVRTGWLTSKAWGLLSPPPQHWITRVHCYPGFCPWVLGTEQSPRVSKASILVTMPLPQPPLYSISSQTE